MTITTTNETVNSEIKSSSFKDYYALMKPNVLLLVTFTSITAMIKAPGKIHPLICITSIIAIMLAAGAAAVFNMYYDRDIDALMIRTAKRPIVVGKIHPNDALSFGFMLAILSILLMALWVNFLSAAILAFTIFFYAVVYTIFLKRSTCQNIVIGGLAGSLPPLIGWTTVTNDVISLEPIILVLLIFFWTPAHFWALSIVYNKDYINSNIPMMTSIKGISYTKKLILIYSLLTIITSFALYFLGFAGNFYLAIAILLNIYFLRYGIMLFKDNKFAKKMFFFSIIYLFGIFLSLIIDKFL